MSGHDFTGVLLAIHIAPAASAPMVALDAARLIADVGIEGDRYANSQRGKVGGWRRAGSS